MSRAGFRRLSSRDVDMAAVRRATGPPRACAISVFAPCLRESFERIHRANLVAVGILPLTFMDGANRHMLGLTGRELFRLHGLRTGLRIGGQLSLDIVRENGDD